MPLSKISTNQINADAIDGTKLADNAINSEHYTDGSIDTAHIADDNITKDKLDSKINQLEPVWIDMVTVNSANHTHQIIDEYGSRVNAQNGNNGPSGRARIRGETGTGNFRVKFQLGTLWGWSEIHFAVPSNYNDATKHNGGDYPTYHTAAQPSGKVHFFVANNGSNNIRYFNYWNGSSVSTQSTVSGGTSNTMNIWRSDGTIYWYDSSSTHTLATSSTDNFIVYAGLQSPAWVRLLDASSYAGKSQ